MGWANCGEDSKGRPIGYAWEAICDHPGCEAEIDRGLAFACGGMHGEDPGCEGYFCSDHMSLARDHYGENHYFCEDCVKIFEDHYKEHCVKCPDCGGSGFEGDTDLWCIRCDNEGTVLPGIEMSPEEIEAARHRRAAIANIVARRAAKEGAGGGA